MYKKNESTNEIDKDGNPTGGAFASHGILIDWQNLPRGRGDARTAENGASLEKVLKACRERLEFFQSSPMETQFNKDAIYHIEQALLALNSRTEDRMVRGVEGTYEK